MTLQSDTAVWKQASLQNPILTDPTSKYCRALQKQNHRLKAAIYIVKEDQRAIHPDTWHTV